MKGKQKNTSDIDFGRDNVTVYLTGYEYERIESIGRDGFNDGRAVKGMLRTFAAIRLYGLAAGTTGYVPIHSDIFKKLAGARNYSRYRDALKTGGCIDYKDAVIEKYEEKIQRGPETVVLNKIKTEKPMQYRTGMILGKDLFPSDKTYPVILEFGKENLDALKSQIEHIRKHYGDKTQTGKRESIIALSFDELVTVSKIKELIKDIHRGKTKNARIIMRHINDIKGSDSREEKDSKGIEELIIRLLDNIREEKEENSEHIGVSELSELFGIKRIRQNISTHQELGYYAELKYEIDALDDCMTMSDLQHLASVNTIPRFKDDGKLYSRLANLRKPIRKHITYGGHRIVEVSDIHCAHFTMLPVIFKRNGVDIPEQELLRFIDLTQRKDLYAEIAKGNDGFGRDDIKPVMQPFFSIKDESQFLFDAEKDRHIVLDFFKRNYPHILQGLLDWHDRFPGVSIKSVANKVESDIMNPICDRLRGLGLHPFRIHDAVYLPEDETDEEKVRYLTDTQFRDLLNVYDRTRNEATKKIMDMFLFSYYVCGLRYSDLLTLEWRHIDFGNRTLTKNVYKTKRSISLPLVDKAVEILLRWRKIGGNSRFVFNLLDEGFYLSDIVKLNNARLTKNRNIQQSLRSVGIKMGLKFNLTIHVARHTFAVQALKNGMDVHTISHLMGHSSSLVTEKVYAEFLPDTINTTVREQLERNVIEYSSS